VNLLEKETRDEHEPTIAPGMNTSDPLEEKASEEDVERGEFTEVTRLYLDRTPGD
jgi:hypothetical protein